MNGSGTPEEKAAKLKALEEKYKRQREAVINAPKPVSVAEYAEQHPQPQSALTVSAAELMTMTPQELAKVIAAILPVKAVSAVPNMTLNRVDVVGITLDQENYDILIQRLMPALLRINIALRIDPNALVRNIRKELRNEEIPTGVVHPFLVGPQHRLFVGMEPDSTEEDAQKAAIIVGQYMASRELFSVANLPEVPAQ